MTGILEAVAISAAASLITAGLTYALTPTQKIEAGRIKDLTVAKSNYGAAIPWCWGTVRVGGNRIWASYKEEVKKKSTVGKLAKVEQSNFTYYGYFADMFCECPFRPVVDITRMWSNKKLVYSKVGGAQTITASGRFAGQYLRFYYGEPAQQIDPLLQVKEPISNFSYGLPANKDERDAFLRSLGIDPLTEILTPLYNKRCYIVAQRLPLADFFNALPANEAELVASENCTVGQIFKDIFGLYYPADAIDVSPISTPEFAVDGYFINSVEAAKNAIQNLQKSHFIEFNPDGQRF